MCKSYKFNSLDLIIPNYDMIETACSSLDKTNMFIISIFRVFIVYIMYQFIIIYLDKYPLTIYLSMFLILLIIIDLISIIIILSKKPKNNE